MSKKKHDDDELDEAQAEKEPAKDAPKPDQIENLSDESGDSARKPYPQGSAPDPEDEFEKIHGYRRQK